MEETLITFGIEIKALGNGKVGGYLIRYSTATDPDLTNDYFTKDTDLHFPSDLPVLYNHGMDKKEMLERAERAYGELFDTKRFW